MPNSTPLGQFTPPSEAFSTGSETAEGAASNLQLFISNMIGMLTILAGMFFIFYFMLGAFSWVTAGGDAGKVSKARDQIIQGAIGLVLIVAAYGIIGLLGRVVGLDILRPGMAILNLVPGATTP